MRNLNILQHNSKLYEKIGVSFEKLNSLAYEFDLEIPTEYTRENISEYPNTPEQAYWPDMGLLFKYKGIPVLYVKVNHYDGYYYGCIIGSGNLGNHDMYFSELRENLERRIKNIKKEMNNEKKPYNIDTCVEQFFLNDS